MTRITSPSMRLHSPFLQALEEVSKAQQCREHWSVSDVNRGEMLYATTHSNHIRRII